MTPAPGDTKRIAIFTICSNNYMPFAHVLFASLRRFHPEAQLFLCLADRLIERGGFYKSDYTVIEGRDLGIPDFPSFAFRYDIMEFNTALKPFMFLHLFEDRGFDLVLYFDPDIEVFAPLTAVVAALHGGASFFLTPHLCSPCEDRREPNDITIMRAGSYNLGFLGVSHSAEAIERLGWWARRLRYQCVDAQAEGLFVDQKFIDLIPGFTPSTVISHDTTLNVAYWNLQQRRLAHSESGWSVDGAPLTFFHFSGFDPGMPDRLSKHDPRFAGDLAEPLRKLTARYAACLLAEGYGAVPRALYAYGQFASGTPIHPLIRRMFRDGHRFWGSDPFDTYEAFLHEPWAEASQSGPDQTITNFMKFLQGAVPRLGGLDLRERDAVNHLIRWFVNDAAGELALDPVLIEPAAARLGRSRRPLTGVPPRRDGGEMDVTVTAPLRRMEDAGTHAQRTFRALLAGGLAVEMLDEASLAAGDGAPVQIICLEADEMPHLLPLWAAQSRGDAYRILVPSWNLAWLPAAALAAIGLVHEVWAPSQFIELSLAGQTDRPVMHMPLVVERDPVAVIPRRHFGLPDDRFLFLSLCSLRPGMDREDPRIAIRAFRRAFPQRGAAFLALAIRSGSLAPAHRAMIDREIDGDPDIMLLDRPMTAASRLGLMASCDALLSLHRSEGTALGLAEAMLLNRPVIATRYSASAAFVTPNTGYPIDYRLVPIESEGHPSGTQPCWAEVDLSHAAWVMARLQAAPERAASLVVQAAKLVRRNHGRDHVAGLQKARLREIGIPRR
jgi:glycosyltransferase involved in cell wall biosynthesis